jgi:molybdopterin synthase sulfur carrier subunit
VRIGLKIFLPALPEVIGGKELEIEFDGESVNDLIEYLVARYGRKAKQALFDEQGQLDPVVQILLNGEEWITHDRLDRTLHDGDQVVLMLMLAGG